MTRQERLTAAKLATLLLAVQFLPPLMLFIGLDTSLKVGTALATVLILAISLTTRVIVIPYECPQRRRRVEIAPMVIAAVIVFAAVMHAAVANQFLEIDSVRLAQTLPLLFLMIASSISFGRLLLTATDEQMRAVLNVSASLIGFCVLLRLSGFGPKGIFEKPVFPFSEPSHFALVLAPLLLYYCVNSSSRKKWLWLLAGFGIAIGIQSLTLLIGCLLIAIASRKIFYVLIAGAIAAVGVVPFEFSYFIDRLDFSSETQNLSSLVYIQGWQQLWESIERSMGWGLGFQQLGVHGTEVSSAGAITALFDVEGLNVQDGSFVFAKLVSELGIFGAVLGAAFVVAAIKSFRSLRSPDERPAVIFAHCLVVCFIVDMFVRGTGYFTGSTLLFITGAAVLLQRPRHSILRLRARAGDSLDDGGRSSPYA